MPLEEIQSMKSKKKRKSLFLVFILLVIAGLVFFFLLRIKHIQPGFVGVKATINNPFDNSGEYDLTEVRGYVFYMPLFSELKIYPTSIQTASYGTIKVQPNDGSTFNIKPRISYQLDVNKVISFYKNHKESLEKIREGYLKEIMANSYIMAAADFDSDSLARNRNLFEEKANKLLALKMAETGLILNNANSNLEIPDHVNEFVELRNTVRQNTTLATEQLREAYAKANIERVKDSLLNSALTQLAIQKMFIDKWDGKLSPEAEIPKPYKDINEASANTKEQKQSPSKSEPE